MEESQTAHYCFNLSGLARTMNDLGLYGGYWLAARGCGDALSFFCILCRCFTPVKRRLTVIHLTHINGHVWIKMTWTSCLLSRKKISKWFVYEMLQCSSSKHQYSVRAKYRTINIESLMIQNRIIWLPFPHVLNVGTHILMELGILVNSRKDFLKA